MSEEIRHIRMWKDSGIRFWLGTSSFIIDSEIETELCGSETSRCQQSECCWISTVCYCRHLAVRWCSTEKDKDPPCHSSVIS